MTSTHPEVHIGKDGWLFLDGGSNDFMAYLRGEKTLPTTTIDHWRTILTSRNLWFKDAGIKYIHVFAPEKATVYPELFQEKINPNLGHIITLHSNFPDLFLNVLPYFNSAKKAYQLYDKTDTHWNRYGAFSCYQLICSILGFQPPRDLFAGKKQPVNALFDLGAKLNPPMREKIEMLIREPKSARFFANLLVRHKEKYKIENEIGLHVGSRAIFKNNSAPYSDKVIIFGDSFSEYRLGRITEMFAETFAEVHFCWSANIDYDYINKVNPNVVITELSERFATIPPNDNFKTDIFARQRLLNHYKDKKLPVIAEKTLVSPVIKHRSRLPITGLRGPDYIIVGSMKCGTTILNDYINEHPDVHPAKQKEIHYFSLYYDKGEEWYAGFFDQAPNDKMTGEASPSYFDMANGVALPQHIRITLPDAKIFVVLKDPVDRALSHFFHLRDINKLPAFQSLDPSEVFSGNLFRKYHDAFLKNPELWPLRNVLDFGNYYLRVHTYKQVFKEKFMVINNADLWTDGQSVMEKVFNHLGLSSFQSEKFACKAYVTPVTLKQINPKAIRSLKEFYKADLEMLVRQFKIKLN